jgi:FkbM family methyltransferase
MKSEPTGPAHSSAYRQTSRLERIGAVMGRALGQGRTRHILRALYRWIIGVATRGGIRSTLPHGEVVRVAPEYRHLTWNPVEYEAFRASMQPGADALDIGANVGAYAILFGLWAGPKGRVLAFEPASEAYAGLCRHLALNGVAAWVRALPIAVSDTVGHAEFLSEGFQGTNRLDAGPARDTARTRVRVPTTTIDTICEAEGLHPRLIKIDVEGAEIAVLRGARKTIAALPAGGGLFVEMHPAAWRASGLTVDDMRAELATQRLRAIPLRECADPWALEGECMRLVRD